MSLLILSLRDIDNTAELASSYNSTIWGNCECFGTKCQRLIFPSQLAGCTTLACYVPGNGYSPSIFLPTLLLLVNHNTAIRIWLVNSKPLDILNANCTPVLGQPHIQVDNSPITDALKAIKLTKNINRYFIYLVAHNEPVE